MDTKLHFSSLTDDWSTPQAYFDKLNEEYGPFDVDVAASLGNAKCSNFFYNTNGLDPTNDGLLADWMRRGYRFFMNPPYGRGINAWVKKAYETGLRGGFVVCLLPARTDTKWFHEYCVKGTVIFIKGRLKFGNAKNAAPFPSMLVIFGDKT